MSSGTWHCYHRTISTFGSIKSFSSANCSTDVPTISKSKILEAVAAAKQTLSCVDNDTYNGGQSLTKQDGSLGLEDIWVLVKYSIKGKCIERSNDAPLSKPVDALFAPSDIQTHSPGADAQGGNGSGRRDGKKPYPKSKPGQGKRRRISDSDKESLEEEERPGDEDEIPGTVSEDDNNHRCPYPGTNCKKKRFQTSDDVMKHVVGEHMDKCCPICEEKLGLRDGRPWVHPESLSFDDFLGFFSSESTYMRDHIFRKHIAPFQCPVDRCKKRLEKRSAKRHLKTHKMLPDVTHDELLTKLCANKYSSLNDRKFNELIKKFDGRPTKKEMKGFLYPNGEKVYDFEDGTDRLIPIEPCQSRNQQPIAENPLDAPPNVPQVPGGYDGSLDYGALFRSISPIFDLSLGLGPATSMGEMSSNSDNLDSTPACFTLSDSDQLLAQSLRNIAPQEVIPSGSLQESIDTPFDHSGSPRTTLHPPSTGSTPATETPQNIGWAAPNVTFPQPDSSSLSQDTMSQIQVDKQIPPRETMAYSGTQLASSSEEVQNTLEELPIEDAEMDQIPLRIVNKLIEDAMASQSAFNMLSELAAIRGVTNAELGHLPHGIGRIFNNTRFLEEFTALSRIMGDNPKVHTVMEKLLGGGTLSDAIFQRRLDNGKIKLLM